MLTIIYHEKKTLTKVEKKLHNIGQTNYQIRNMNKEPLTTKEISFITQYYDIISLFRHNNWRTKYLNSLKNSTCKTIIDIIKTNPQRIKSPILIDIENNKVLIGLNNDDINMFMPKQLRKKQLKTVIFQ